MAYVVDILIDNRLEYRLSKQYKAADDMRDILDGELVFCFDLPGGIQQVLYLTESYFKFKDKFEYTRMMTNRQYVEYRMHQDRKADSTLNAWIFSNRPKQIQP